MGMITKPDLDPVCVLYDLGMARMYTDGDGNVREIYILFNLYFFQSCEHLEQSVHFVELLNGHLGIQSKAENR